MPTVRAFRALRYSAEVVPDLAAVVAPPYDVISPELRRDLLARDPRNVVRLDYPPAEPGDPDDDERYRRAGRLLRAWRSDGILRRDPRPSLYPYEQAFRLPGSGGGEPLVRRGVFARLALERFGPGSGVRPHERTLSGAREDRYRLLRATGVNTSPVVGMYEDAGGDVARWLERVAATSPLADVVDIDGTRHRLWVEADPGGIADLMGASPITIADGHHRYETALRYRDERRHGLSAGEEAGPWDDVLALLLEPIAGPVAILATHRVIRGLGESGVATLRARLPELFEVESGVSREHLLATFRPGEPGPAAGGRFGLWTRHGGATLEARREAFASSLPPGGRALRQLDVTLLGVALERLAEIDASVVDAGATMAYTKDAGEAIAWVDEGRDGAVAAFLLDPTPASAVMAVAADGDVMPQKSTYIHPKALTGLVINPLE